MDRKIDSSITKDNSNGADLLNTIRDDAETVLSLSLRRGNEFARLHYQRQTQLDLDGVKRGF